MSFLHLRRSGGRGRVHRLAALCLRSLLAAAFALTLAAPPASAKSPSANRPAASGDRPAYALGAGDRLRIIVFGEDDLSGEFEVDGSGILSMKLIGPVNVGGLTLRQTEKLIARKLRNGYLLDPRVNVEVMNYRPFYILGEVENRGSYPYVYGMSVATAVAIAGGYTYRASQGRITIQRFSDPSRREQPANEETPVLPGDIIRVPERIF